MIKTEIFQQDLQDLAKFGKILSHPARLMILKYLAVQKACISGDITNEIPLSRTTVSQHLKELKNAGLIKGKIEGSKINYCLCNSNIEILKNKFNKFLNDIETVNEINC